MEGKGLTGLANLGNTCFINSCMQVLSHTQEFNNFLLLYLIDGAYLSLDNCYQSSSIDVNMC